MTCCTFPTNVESEIHNFAFFGRERPLYSPWTSDAMLKLKELQIESFLEKKADSFASSANSITKEEEHHLSTSLTWIRNETGSMTNVDKFTENSFGKNII